MNDARRSTSTASMVAREAGPQEEAQLWPLLEAMYTEFAEYRARCEGVRHIPVLIFDEKE